MRPLNILIVFFLAPLVVPSFALDIDSVKTLINATNGEDQIRNEVNPWINQSSESIFWTWFEENQDKIANLPEDHSFAPELKSQLESYNELLTFEVGPGSNGKMHFIISCDGIREGIPYVQQLGGTAPDLEKWKIIQFRQPIDEITLIEQNGVSLDPEDIKIRYIVEESTIHLQLFIDNYSANEEMYMTLAFVLLDNLVGEYFVMTQVGEINFKPLASNTGETKLIPFNNIRNIVDTMLR